MELIESKDTVRPNSNIKIAEKFNPRYHAAERMKAGEWHADLNLEIEQRPAGARLVSCKRNGPLHVQKTFYPEGDDIAHLYILHPPGGLVSGDSLTINAQVGRASSALITTPGAGRIYGSRATARHQIQHNNLRVATQASLEWFPMETQFYSGSNGVSNTRVEIEDGGTFMGWDIASLGLPASGRPFTSGKVRQAIEISYKGELSWIERWHFDANDHEFLNSPVGLNGYSANGVFVAGPFHDELPDELMKRLHCLCQTVSKHKHGVAGVTQVGQWLAMRYVGTSTTKAREYFTQAWQELRPALINRVACPPRIWAC
ncbi:MAG: urease accessory protein [Paraglaciecola sp.]|jgi:urease accessory protein